jgi:hypothetical protein
MALAWERRKKRGREEEREGRREGGKKRGREGEREKCTSCDCLRSAVCRLRSVDPKMTRLCLFGILRVRIIYRNLMSL